MNFFRLIMLLLIVGSHGLYAGAPEDITKGSQLEKAFQLVVEHRVDANDANKLMVTVCFKIEDFHEMHLIGAGTSVKIIPVADGDMMKVTFGLRKEDLESSRLIIETLTARSCGNSYSITIKGYTS